MWNFWWQKFSTLFITLYIKQERKRNEITIRKNQESYLARKRKIRKKIKWSNFLNKVFHFHKPEIVFVVLQKSIGHHSLLFTSWIIVFSYVTKFALPSVFIYEMTLVHFPNIGLWIFLEKNSFFVIIDRKLINKISLFLSETSLSY
jgi:hypothetical protein